MKKAKYIILLILFNHTLLSQSVANTTYNNVRKIDMAGIVNNGNDYLVDVVIDKSKPIVLFSYNKNPNLFFAKEFVESVGDYTLITLANPAASHSHRADCAKPLFPIYDVYKIRKEKNTVKIDSLIDLQPDSLILNFYEPDNNVNSHKIYYTDYWGNKFTPSSKTERSNEIFNYRNKVLEKIQNKIGKTLTRVNGKEGEREIYFKLENLSNQERLYFIKCMLESDLIGKEESTGEMRIFFPILITD